MTIELPETPRVAVIIPYFQTKSGVLARAIQSALAQKGKFSLTIVITDDESPVPAEDELARLDLLPTNIDLIRQKNAGPGAARNNCLDHVPSDTAYVALLDSDDEWNADFLNHAVHAMNLGYDLFFSDTERFSQEATRFNWSAYPERNLTADRHKRIHPDLELYEYSGDFFDFAIYRSNIISSSAMVYRLNASAGLRFDPRIFNGQDRLFKLKLVHSIGKVAFSPRVLCHEGEGVNIFDGATWGSQRSLARSSSYIRLAKQIREDLRLTPSQDEHVIRQLRDARQSFAANLLHLIAKGQVPSSKVAWETLRLDPLAYMAIAPVLSSAVRRRLFKQ